MHLDQPLSSRIQRNCKGWKITAYVNNKIQQSHKATATSELGIVHGPCMWQHQGWGGGGADCFSHISYSTHWSVPTHIPFKEPAPPPLGSKQGHPLLVVSSSCLPEILIRPLTNFYWLKSPRTQAYSSCCPGQTPCSHPDAFFSQNSHSIYQHINSNLKMYPESGYFHSILSYHTGPVTTIISHLD